MAKCITEGCERRATVDFDCGCRMCVPCFDEFVAEDKGAAVSDDFIECPSCGSVHEAWAADMLEACIRYDEENPSYRRPDGSMRAYGE